MRYTVLGVSFLVMLAAYTVGTFNPDTRGCTGPLTILAMVLVMGSAVASRRVRGTRLEKGNTPMLTLIGRIGCVVLVGMAALGVWRAYTYSALSQAYAPFVLILLLVAVLMSVSLLARGRRS